MRPVASTTFGGRRPSPGALLALAAALACAAPAAAPTTRYHQFTKKFEKAPDRAEVLAAGYLGGPGTEWLVSGGFQPDGTVVVAGVALGPTLELGGAAAKVLGKDAAAPPAPERKPRRERGKPVTDKKGNPVYEPFAWTHESATAFVARLSADLRQVKSVTRFPWKAGGVTSAAVDSGGNVYLTGPAGGNILDVGGPHRELSPRDNKVKKAACRRIYLCKLSPDGGKVLWLRTLKGASDAPAVSLDTGGKIHLQGPDLRTLTAEGDQKTVTVVPGGLTTRPGSAAARTTAVNPRDGTFARAGERPWPAGRETYRAPVRTRRRRRSRRRSGEAPGRQGARQPSPRSASRRRRR
jgi:hypothetical protein